MLPLNDAKLLDEPKPIGPDGQDRLDPAKPIGPARRPGASRPERRRFPLVILGGSHDLTESRHRSAGAPCEYLRVTTECYQEFAEEE
jgi:hypothetical protein